MIHDTDEVEVSATDGGDTSDRPRVRAAAAFARFIIPALPRFRDAHPGVEVDVMLGD